MGLEVLIWNLHWAIALALILPLLILWEITSARGAERNRKKFQRWGGTYLFALYGAIVGTLIWVGAIHSGAPEPMNLTNRFTPIVKIALTGIFAYSVVKIMQVPLETELRVRPGMTGPAKKKIRQKRAVVLTFGIIAIIVATMMIVFILPWLANGWAYQGGVKNAKPGVDLVFNSTVIAIWGGVIYGIGVLLVVNTAYVIWLIRSRKPLQQRRLMRTKKRVALAMVLINLVVLFAISVVFWTNVLDIVLAFLREGLHVGFTIPGLGDLGQIDFSDPDWLSKYINAFDWTNWTNWTSIGETPEIQVPEYESIEGGSEYQEGSWPPSWWPS